MVTPFRSGCAFLAPLEFFTLQATPWERSRPQPPAPIVAGNDPVPQAAHPDAGPVNAIGRPSEAV